MTEGHSCAVCDAVCRVNAVCPGPTLTEGTKRHAASQGKSIDEACTEMTSHMIMPRFVPSKVCMTLLALLLVDNHLESTSKNP